MGHRHDLLQEYKSKWLNELILILKRKENDLLQVQMSKNIRRDFQYNDFKEYEPMVVDNSLLVDLFLVGV